MNDPISDTLTRIRNAYSSHKEIVKSPASKLVVAILDVLKNEGYINDYSSHKCDHGQLEAVVTLKYNQGLPAISRVKRVSTPGRRMYTSVDAMPKVSSGLGVYILSTSQGVMSDHQARRLNVGGEILCEVF